MKKVFVVAVIASLLAACGGSGDQAISVDDPWARVTGSSAAIYLTVENNTDTDKAITGVEADSSVAKSVMLHDTATDGSGMMTMNEQEKVTVPANGSVEFKTASYHVMVMGVQDREAETLPITLDFEDGTKLEVDAEVREAN